MNTIYSRIFDVRSHFNFSQKEFAEKINVSFRNLQNYETGKTENIPHTFLYALSETFGVDLNWLFFGVGEMFCNTIEKTLNINQCPCGGQAYYLVYPNKFGIDAHSVGCDCGLILIGFVGMDGKNKVIEKWNATFPNDGSLKLLGEAVKDCGL